MDADRFTMDCFRLDHRVAVVTGAGRGIGKALALGLAEAGATVAVAELPDRLPDAQKVADAITAAGGRAVVVPLDVRNLSSIDRMVERVVDTLGAIDILVNNAGIQIAKPAVEITEEDWDAVLDVNLKGVFFCSQRVGRWLIAHKREGVIINIASQNGLVGYYNRAPYCSAKAGVVNLTRVLAIEWASYGIRVNAVAPTFIRTPLGEQTLRNEEFRRDILSRIPLGRIGEPNDVVGAVIYLASPAASLVTGATLVVDGGWTAL